MQPTPIDLIPLEDRILAIMSLAAETDDVSVPEAAIHEIFADVSNYCRRMFPTLSFNRTPGYAYSKPLGQALQALTPFCIEIRHSPFPDLVVTTEQSTHHLTRLRGEYGITTINQLKPAAEEFIRSLHSHKLVA